MPARTALLTLAILLPLAGSAQAASHDRPDLVVPRVWLTDADGNLVSDADSGSPLVVHARVRNDGSAAAGRFSVRFLIDGAMGAQTVIDGLAAGKDALVRSASWTPAPGAHEIVVEADPGRDVFERSEDNNRRALAVEAANTHLRLEVDETLRATSPFEAADYELRLVNLDSAPQTVRLKASGGGPGWTYRLVDEHVDLPVGGAATTRLTVLARPGGAPATIVVEARPVDAPAVVETVSTRTLLLP